MNRTIPDTMNEIIAQNLDDGYRIYSMALGRVGEILSVDKGDSLFPVTICSQSRPNKEVKRHRHIHGATTFNSGDRVVLQKRQGEKYLRVVNKELS